MKLEDVAEYASANDLQVVQSQSCDELYAQYEKARSDSTALIEVRSKYPLFF